MINIVVCIKAVPSRIVNVDDKNMDPYILNPYDQYALRQVLELKKKIDCKVTCLCMGRNDLDKMLYRCKAMGADDIILVSDRAFAGADTYATSYTLAEALKQLPYDLIVCGAEAVDGETGQVPAGIAKRLDILCVTGVEKIEELNENLTLECNENEQKVVMQVKLPALIAFKDCSTKSLPINLLALKKAQKKAITVWNAESLALKEENIGQLGSKTLVHGSLGANFKKKDSVQIDIETDGFVEWFEKQIQM